MSGAPQVAMRSALQSWQIFFPSQTLQVICFSFAKPSDFLFGPSQKGTICSSACLDQHTCYTKQIASEVVDFYLTITKVCINFELQPSKQDKMFKP